MALPASGQISLRDIYFEIEEDNPILPVSLKELSDGTVATINTENASANRPDGSAPHEISEFYSYDHDLTSSSWGTSWSANTVSIPSNPGSTSYYNRSITFNGFSNDNIAMFFTVNSGTVRGSLSVATSTSGFPNNSATYRGVGTNSANFGFGESAFSINGSGTLYCRFKYVQHSSLHETSNRTIKVIADGETSPGTNQVNFDDSGGGFP